MMTHKTTESLEGGRALFNSGRYFEAHEAWEDGWREETGDVRRTLHGLIQIAAGYHKATKQSQPSGCARLLEAGLEKLAELPADSCGLALGEFRPAIARALAEARRWQAGERENLGREFMAELTLAVVAPGHTE